MTGSRITHKFVEKYSRAYHYQDDEEFSSILRKRRIDAEDLASLLKWKSTRYSKKVRKVLQRNLNRLNVMRSKPRMAEDRIDELIRKAYPDYPASSPVFGTFIKHIVDPSRFPILDQYAHRAYHELNKKPSIPKHSKCDVSNTNCYTDYSRWFNAERRKLGVTGKKLDEALWRFGRDLSQDE